MNDSTKTDKPAFTIRSMEERDLNEVLRLEKIIFPDPWPKSAFTEQISGEGWGALVAEAEGEVVGYGCYFTVEIEAHLTNIAVREDYRRKSVANALLNTILQRVAEERCQYLLLEVRQSNSIARTFYEKRGFRTLYERPNYYRRPVENALVMVYYLDSN